jgi:hypothetical protein
MFCPPLYLKPEHLKGKRVTVQIQRIAIEEVHPHGRAEQKPVAYFVGKEKGLILSPTNQRTLKTLFGDDCTAAHSKLVTLEATPIQVAGRDTTPIRIGPAQQPQTTPPPA